MIFSSHKTKSSVQILPGFSSNDANHISGPSRTGDGLFSAIQKSLDKYNIKPSEIDYINAHGTATIYNDDMESKAFKLADLDHTPINSFKSNFGHTLGAAGVIESIIGIESLRSGTHDPRTHIMTSLVHTEQIIFATNITF